MARLAIRLCERFVGDLLQEVLEKCVLAALRRARVGLHGENLLADERGEDLLELRRVQGRQRGEARFREALAEDCGILEEATFLGL